MCQRWHMFGVVPSVEVGLDLGAGSHADQQQPTSPARRRCVAREDLLALVTEQPLDLAGHPLRPWRQVFAADGAILGTLQNGEAVEVVGRDRLFRILGADPALKRQETRHTLPLGYVFGVVPVVELVGRHIREIHRCNQDALGHRASSYWVIVNGCPHTGIVGRSPEERGAYSRLPVGWT